MSLSEATGAPAPVTIGDKTYQATPLNLWELGSIEESVRAVVLNAATRAAADLPQTMGDRLIDRALSKVLTITFFSDDARKYMATFRGSCELVALSLAAKHPEVKARDVAAALSEHTEQYDAAVMTVMRISKLLAEKDEKGGEKPGEAQGAAGA